MNALGLLRVLNAVFTYDFTKFSLITEINTRGKISGFILLEKPKKRAKALDKWT